MKKAGTKKGGFVNDGTLIVAVNAGREMNRGFCTTIDGKGRNHF